MKPTYDSSVVTVGKITGVCAQHHSRGGGDDRYLARAHPGKPQARARQRVSLATHVAEGLGTTAEVKIPMSLADPVIFKPRPADQMRPVLASVAGPDRVVDEKPVTGAEDLVFIAEKYPAGTSH